MNDFRSHVLRSRHYEDNEKSFAFESGKGWVRLTWKNVSPLTRAAE